MASGAECQGAECRCKLVGRFPLANEKTQLEYPKPKRKNKIDEDIQYQLVLKQLEKCKISTTYIRRQDTDDKNKWVCQAPDCCNNQKFFSTIEIRNHLFKKFNVAKYPNEVVVYNMGCGITAHTPDDAMDKFFEREFEDVKACNEKHHGFKCIPDSYNYGSSLVIKVAIDETKGKACKLGDDAAIAGKKVEEKLVNKLRNAFEELDVKNTVMISGFQEKPQGKNDQQLETDILIICKDSKTIIQIESKKSFEMKAFKQLDNGYNYFNSKIPFQAEHGWQYVKVAYFEEGWKQEENCKGCDPYVLTKNFDIFEWLKRMKVSNTPTNISSTDPTYICTLKFLFYQMYQNEDCITQDDLLQLTERNIEAISSPKKKLFYNKVQFDLLNQPEGCERVVFLSQFGTGKTTVLKEKARRLLNKGQKVAFIVFKDKELKEDSLLFQNYQQEFKEFRDMALVIEIPSADSTLNEAVIRSVKKNPGFHFFMDEVPIMSDGILLEAIIEISKDSCLQEFYLWLACQSENAPEKVLLEENFFCPEMPHPLRYSANLLKITKAIKNIRGGTSFPSQETNPDLYLNRGPRAIFFTLKKGTNLACAVEQVVYILEHEKAKTLIKIDFEPERILQELKKSPVSKKLVENLNVNSEDSGRSEEKILVVTSKDNGLIRGLEFSILVHFTETIDGDKVELIYSRCKSKLIIVSNEDVPNEIVGNNASCEFAQLIPVHDTLMPQSFEKSIQDKNLSQVLGYIKDKRRPLPIDITNKASQTGLMIACISEALKIVEEFLKNGANLDAVDAEGWTPIHHASKNGCLEIVKRVDEAMSKLNLKHYDYKRTLTMKTNEGKSALHIAAEAGRLKVVQYLVTKNFFDVNDKTTDNGSTPLQLASYNGHSDVVRCLVNECNADVNLKNNDGWTPLHRASLNGHSDVVRCLVNECKADVNLKDKYGSTPLHVASMNGHSDVVRCLVIECKADVHLKNDFGETPLHLASSNGHSDVVRCLVNDGKADVNLKNDVGWPPLHLASFNGHSDVVRCLVNECKADVNLKDKYGDTPLHDASRFGHSDVVRCLVIDGKADVNLKNDNGRKPIDIARNDEIESFLESKSQQN